MLQQNHLAPASGDRRLPMLRDVLLSATAGKVQLCLDPAELPDPLARAGPSLPLALAALPEFRRMVYEYAAAQRLPAERRQQILTAAGEAAMNAVMHGGGGVAALATDGRGTIQVRITDCGVKTMVEPCERSAPGYGWWLIARSADRVWIYPGVEGMVVILEQDRIPLDARLDPDAGTDRDGSPA
jgi:anti-sigma regulatory factor (Ser/Thr protein kinase)